MLLVKCKCGCFFTLKEDWATHNRRRLTCQNCFEDVPLDPYAYIEDLQKNLKAAGIEVHVIPDTGKVTATFDI